MTKDTVYIVTRADLEPGAQLAQSVHAAFVFAAEHGAGSRWADAYLIVKAVPDEKVLGALLREARGQRIRASCFHEPDLQGALTAIALEPGPGSKRLCARYPRALCGASGALTP